MCGSAIDLGLAILVVVTGFNIFALVVSYREYVSRRGSVVRPNNVLETAEKLIERVAAQKR